jgi:hypothetical protein
MCCDLGLRVSTEVKCGDIKVPQRMTVEERLMVPNTIRNVDVCTMHFVQFTVFVQQMHNIYIYIYIYIYTHNICFLQHSYLFWCIRVIYREFIFMYAKVTKLIKWEHLYKWLLQRINRLNNQQCLNMFYLTHCLTVSRYALCWLLWHLPTEQGQIISLFK